MSALFSEDRDTLYEMDDADRPDPPTRFLTKTAGVAIITGTLLTAVFLPWSCVNGTRRLNEAIAPLRKEYVRAAEQALAQAGDAPCGRVRIKTYEMERIEEARDDFLEDNGGFCRKWNAFYFGGCGMRDPALVVNAKVYGMAFGSPVDASAVTEYMLSRQCPE